MMSECEHQGTLRHSINPRLTFQSGSSLGSEIGWDHLPGGLGGMNMVILDLYIYAFCNVN